MPTTKDPVSSGPNIIPDASKPEIGKTDASKVDTVKPDKLSHCNWKKGPVEAKSMAERTKIYPDILHVIGNTPLVELRKIPKSANIKCRMLAKCEFMNPGGSVKDRIGYRMILEAEAAGILKPGSTVIEPTSGNTGIGLAMACAIRGYRCIIVMPDKMSNEKVAALRALGAEIIRTPIEAAFDDPEGLIAVAYRMQKETPNSVILDQYGNCGNPLAHYDGTGAELLWGCDEKIDMIVMGAGTGGTVTGVGRRIKEHLPDCTIVAVDPHGSILATPHHLNSTDTTFYEVEGIGYDFIPDVLDHKSIDKWIKVGDKESFKMARRLHREEGLLCGGSSGTAMYAALEAAKDLREDQTCVVLLPDSIRNYMTKFVSDNWMEARDFKESINTHAAWWWDHNVTELNLSTPKSFKTTLTCEEALRYMKDNSLEQIPVLRDNGAIMGAVTYDTLTTQIVSQNMQLTDPVKKAIYKKSIKVNVKTNLGRIGRILETEPFVFILSEDEEELVGTVTQKQLLNFIMAGPSTTANGTKNGHTN